VRINTDQGNLDLDFRKSDGVTDTSVWKSQFLGYSDTSLSQTVILQPSEYMYVQYKLDGPTGYSLYSTLTKQQFTKLAGGAGGSSSVYYLMSSISTFNSGVTVGTTPSLIMSQDLTSFYDASTRLILCDTSITINTNIPGGTKIYSYLACTDQPQGAGNFYTSTPAVCIFNKTSATSAGGATASINLCLSKNTHFNDTYKQMNLYIYTSANTFGYESSESQLRLVAI
jgi:hypothetical protein